MTIIRFLLLTGITITLWVSASGCGDASTKPEEGAPQEATGLWPAASLDCQMNGRTSTEMPVAGQVFWRRLREVAIRLDEHGLVSGRSLDDPASLDVVERELRRMSVDFEDLDAEFRRRRMVVERFDIGPWTGHILRLHGLRGSNLARMLRNLVPHPASPDLTMEGLRILDADGAKTVMADGAHIRYFGHLPDFDEIEAAARSGAAAAIAVSKSGETIEDIQVPKLVDVAGRAGRALPIPLIYAPEANRQHLKIAQNQAEKSWRLDLRSEPVDQRAAGVSLLFRGADSSRRIVVTHSRYWRRLFSGRGSEALPLATMIEAARVIAAQFSRPAENGAHDLAVDLEFVHVADAGAGYGWLESRAMPNVHILGVVDLGSLVTIPPNANPLIVVDGGEAKSAIERAMIGVARDYAGEGPAWPAYAVLDRGPSEASSLSRAWHQERVPIVGLSLARNEGSDWRGPATQLPRTDAQPAPIFGEHPAVGTARDSIRELTDERLTGPVAIARVLVLALARLQECF